MDPEAAVAPVEEQQPLRPQRALPQRVTLAADVARLASQMQRQQRAHGVRRRVQHADAAPTQIGGHLAVDRPADGVLDVQ